MVLPQNQRFGAYYLKGYIYSMKKVILLLFIPFIVNGQITTIKQEETAREVKIGSYKYSDFNMGELSYFVLNGDTTISLNYYNQKYPTLKDRKFIIFKGGAKEISELYILLMSFYSEENINKKDMKLEFNLGKTFVSVSRVKKQLMFWTESGYFTLDKGNINSLFKM